MTSIIQSIYDFNHEADLVKGGYNDYLESSFQIEEALEGLSPEYIMYSMHGEIQDTLDGSPTSPKDVARHLVQTATASTTPIPDVDRLDKACDAVVFAIGSMTKLGLSPSQIEQALSVVVEANTAKLGCPKDPQGKLIKPPNFNELYAPEPKLQEILDQRS
jgi:predicted HAD superfamily Cof-like phosphohydrolase